MRKAIGLIFVVALFGCDKGKSGGTDTATTAAKPAASPAAAKPSAAPSAAASAAPSAAPAGSEGSAFAEGADDQEGLEKGEVVVGWIQDEKDEGQCAALPAPAAEKAKWDEKKIQEVATQMKAKVVKSCPSDNTVGTCKMMGMLVNYSGPKYTIDSAKAHCKKNRGKWFD